MCCNVNGKPPLVKKKIKMWVGKNLNLEAVACVVGKKSTE